MDVTQVKTFVRTVLELRLEPARATLPGGRTMLVLSLRGTAFLWHQVRCMAAVLLMVGRGLEPAGIVARLLDVSREPTKPLYTLASEEPLLLAGCAYPPGELDFVRTQENHRRILQDLGRQLDRCGPWVGDICGDPFGRLGVLLQAPLLLILSCHNKACALPSAYPLLLRYLTSTL